MNTPTNDYEALVLALYLALTAKEGEDEKVGVCVGMAEKIAARMPADQVEKAKAEADGTSWARMFEMAARVREAWGAANRGRWTVMNNLIDVHIEPIELSQYEAMRASTLNEIDLPFNTRLFVRWFLRVGRKDLKLLETALEAADHIEETGHYELAAQHTTTGRPEIFRGEGR